MHEWYVVQVLSGQEKTVAKALSEHREHSGMTDVISDILVPTENVSEIKQGKKKVTERRIWPGYILVKMVLSDESWSYVKNTNGVIDFLGGGSPTALTDAEVEQTLADLQDKRATVTEKHQFKIGDRVKIVDGVFVNFIGTVTEVFHDKGRLSVLVSIFGRDTPVDDLEFWQVEEVPEDAEANS